MSMDYPPPPTPTNEPALPTYPLPASNVEPVAPSAPPVPYQPAQPPPVYQAAPAPLPYGQQAAHAFRLPKSKTAAVLMAIFLGSTTWIYTWERDSWKFWTALAIGLVNVVLSLVTLGFWVVVAVPVGIGIWIWGIIDTAAKSQQFYDLYPAA